MNDRSLTDQLQGCCTSIGVFPDHDFLYLGWYVPPLTFHISPRVLTRLLVVSSLRVYAISNRGFSLALVTLALGLVPVGTNLVSRCCLTSRLNEQLPHISTQFNYIESSYFVSTYSLFVECEYSQKFSDAIGFRREYLRTLTCL